MLPVTMIVPVLKDLIKVKHSGQNWEVALFMSLAMLGSFLFSPIAGFLSDRFQTRKKFINVFFFVDGALILSLALVDDLNILMGLRFLEGVAHIFVIGLLISMVADEENNPQSVFFQKGKIMGILGMSVGLGAAMGMPLGFLGKKDPMLPFYAGAGLLFALGFFSFSLKDKIHLSQKKVSIPELKIAFVKNPNLWVPFAFNFIDRFTVGFLISSFNLHLREDLQFSPGMVGLALSLILFPMSLLSYPVAILSRKTGVFALVLGGSLVYGLFLGIAGFIQTSPLIFLILLIAGLGAGVMFVPSMMLANHMSPHHLKATVMSGFTGAGSLGFMLGPLASVGLESLAKQNLSQEWVIPFLSSSFGGLEVLLVLLCLPYLKKLHSSAIPKSND